MNRLGVDNIPEAEILSEQTYSLSDGNDAFINWIARTAENITSGNRGSWITEALILAGYAKDEQELRRQYQANKAPIDAYFEQVNVEKIINEGGPDIQQQITRGLSEKVKEGAPFIIAGTILAAGTIIGIKKYKQSK